MADDLETRRRRVLYRARHRGTKEMDWLLGRFADAALGTMDETELALFERFAALPDPQLHGWIMAPDALDMSEMAGLVAKIREYHGL